jgi:hypothetical protein
MIVDLTWDEIRARSQTEKNGHTVFCFDCYMCFEAARVPCLKHCQSDTERAERMKRLDAGVAAEVAQWKRMSNGQ